jgi:hypothetical protein
MTLVSSLVAYFLIDPDNWSVVYLSHTNEGMGKVLRADEKSYGPVSY